MTQEQETYLAYMLRLWPVEVRGEIKWRASLQCVSSGERQGFEDLEELFEHLRKEIQAKDASGLQ
jgi:hypothetical protein